VVVELDRRLIPLQHGPLHALIAALAGGAGQGAQQRLAVPRTAGLRTHVEILLLQWNQPSIEFYRSLGAVPMDGWDVYRLTGDALVCFRARVRSSALPCPAPRASGRT
jgi:hypothetical protein